MNGLTLEYLGFDLTTAICLALIVFTAAVLRGFAGFGFGALLLAGGALFIEPVQLVPVSLALEVVATLHMLPSIMRSINWQAVGWIGTCSLVSMPFAQHLLIVLPAAASRAVVFITIIILVALMLRGARLKVADPRGVFAGAGLLSGFINGVAAVGGIVSTLTMLGLGAGAAVVRATTAMYLMIADIGAIGISYATGAGLFHALVWWRVAALVPVLILGVWLGSRRFEGTSEATWRRIALGLPVILSVIGLARLAWQHLGT